MKKFPIRIRKPKNLSGTEIGLILFLGCVSGYYIWKPLIVESITNQKNTTELQKK